MLDLMGKTFGYFVAELIILNAYVVELFAVVGAFMQGAQRGIGLLLRTCIFYSTEFFFRSISKRAQDRSSFV